VRPHALPDAAFAGLAAGRPSRATVEELRRSQLSKHLLLLRAIVQAVSPAGLPGYADLQAADPAAVRARVADPMFGVWAASCLAALTGGAAPDEAGAGHLAGAVHPGSHRLRASHAGLAIDLRLEDADPLRSRLGLTPTGRLADGAVQHWQTCLTEAWRLLVDRHRPAAGVLAAVLRVIVPVEPDPAARGISATSADAFGAVAMSAPEDAVELAVGLLHETQHSLLNAVYYLFDLHVDPAALGYSPWRDDPRPASGILHGAYAYLAVTRFWRTEASLPNPSAGFEFARWRAAVAGTAEELLTEGLTAAGARFVGALRDEVCPWLDEPVPPAVGRLATGANVDHRTRWRLRNLRVDPGAAGMLADLWRRGLAAPPELAVSRVVPAPGRALENNDRLALTHRLLRTRPGRSWGEVLGGLQPGGAATAGDVAYLRGDYGAAADAYRKRIVRDPGDDAAWAGLALVSPQEGLRRRPEVVAALYRAISTEKPFPEALATWISP
jgi:hypothetical protein